jgi:hypothetical protein
VLFVLEIGIASWPKIIVDKLQTINKLQTGFWVWLGLGVGLILLPEHFIRLFRFANFFFWNSFYKFSVDVGVKWNNKKGKMGILNCL